MPPRPRFEKLEEEKKRSILEIAAEEFAQSGFSGASFNRIIERAGISKGAAYYYFDDKSDLFDTVISMGIDQFEWFLRDTDAVKESEEFWAVTEEHFHRGIGLLREHVWMGKFLKVLIAVVQGDDDSKMARAAREMAHWKTSNFLKQGQAKGAVRTDLPDELLSQCLFSISITVDQWFLERGAELSDEDVTYWASLLTDMMRRLLEPHKGGQ